MRSFDPFPPLDTPRLHLRRLTPDDAEIIFRIQSDPEVIRYFGRAGDASIEAARERVARIDAGIREHTSIRWGITLRDTGELIGTAGFWRWNKPHRNAEIGYDLRPAWWGRGLMPEAVRAILRFGFDEMDLHRVEANVDTENQRSVRVLERLGFVREGVLRENWLNEGRFTDTGTYGLLRRDFE